MSCVSALNNSTVTWVTNTESGATSQYDNFGFNSYAQTASETLAAAEDGIYVLTGEVESTCVVQFPKRDFGSGMLKRMPYIWASIASDRPVTLDVTILSETYSYDPNDDSPDMTAQRYDLGQGLLGVFWTVALRDRAAFELESIRFMPVELNRRT